MVCRNPSDGSAVPCCLSNSSGGRQQTGSVCDPMVSSVSLHSPSAFELLGDLVHVLQEAAFAVSVIESIAI